ncbi:hypothetical protein C0580_03720 [Candidatus Parcubacteria bacterium]|nr:MAG: hypothetical protein C0580_03720 [Candidatus Parcubacteria bacterium]
MAMTSDLARAPEGASVERRRLAQMLSGYCVSLGKLRPDEFDDILKKILLDLYIRNLRGFKPLRQSVSSGGDEPVNTDDDTKFVAEGFEGVSFTMDTQTQVLHRGVIAQDMVWREDETGQEFSGYSHDKPKEWGRITLVRGSQTFLILMRLPKGEYGYDNLVLVTSHYEKIPRRKAYRVTRLVARRLLVKDFREVLGESAPRVANEMIMGIGDIISRSITALQGDVSVLEQAKVRWRELSGILTE